ncbi:hypothetical protein BT96DRAFT_948941 [Gymnopus androsaceus JB14]|uniref:Endoplasmic reticulum vesicle transporter C-terminal domain-containing protein n=1 Tax=Gymnopus androsaceus JB14 TaxID=1447944 RepID=A0A6A4GLU7_9AGAR|nr:hypothetical protein BT96DRAFT_948941 [Gymnopus androsaceus JB14]
MTHYTRIMEHSQGTPGIFFKFDLDLMSLTIHQRTTTFAQLLICCVGVIRGVFVVTGSNEEVIVAARSSGTKAGLHSKWGGGKLHSCGKMVHQGSGWTMESNPGSPAIGSGYGSYTGMPVSSIFSLIPTSLHLGSPSMSSPMLPSSTPGTPI